MDCTVSTTTIKKNDTVIAISGTSSGKTGKVLHVETGKHRALVEGLNIVKKTMRKTQENPQGGIVEKEASIAISNLMPYCPDCKKGVRIKRGREAGKPVRACVSAGCTHTFGS